MTDHEYKYMTHAIKDLKSAMAWLNSCDIDLDSQVMQLIDMLNLKIERELNNE